MYNKKLYDFALDYLDKIYNCKYSLESIKIDYECNQSIDTIKSGSMLWLPGNFVGIFINPNKNQVKVVIPKENYVQRVNGKIVKMNEENSHTFYFPLPKLIMKYIKGE